MPEVSWIERRINLYPTIDYHRPTLIELVIQNTYVFRTFLNSSERRVYKCVIKEKGNAHNYTSYILLLSPLNVLSSIITLSETFDTHLVLNNTSEIVWFSVYQNFEMLSFYHSAERSLSSLKFKTRHN